MNITKVEVTYEDGSTFLVHPKLAPDVQGTSVEDLTPEVTAPVEPTAEPVEPAEEVAATE